MRGIMAARTKPLKVLEPVAAETFTTVENFELPPAKAGVKLVPADNPEELVRLLHEEAKVFKMRLITNLIKFSKGFGTIKNFKLISCQY